MLARLIDLLFDFIELFQVFFYVDQFEQAVVLRAGKYSRTAGPGPHWLAPLGIERVIAVNTKPEPLYLDTQTSTTKDGYIVTFQVAVVYAVTDARVHLIEWEQAEVIVGVLAGGIMRQSIADHTWVQIHSENFLPNCHQHIRQACKKLGVSVWRLDLLDMASGSADRLWVEGVDLG